MHGLYKEYFFIINKVIKQFFTKKYCANSKYSYLLFAVFIFCIRLCSVESSSGYSVLHPNRYWKGYTGFKNGYTSSCNHNTIRGDINFVFNGNDSLLLYISHAVNGAQKRCCLSRQHHRMRTAMNSSGVHRNTLKNIMNKGAKYFRVLPKTIALYSSATVTSLGTAAQQGSSDSVSRNAARTYKFQAEVSRVMDIIVNSLYTDRDVFLRELISNAADACDKKKILVGAKNVALNQCIKVKADKENKTLMVHDTGIGMNQEELIKNLGTIAHSGTSKFLQQVEAGKADMSMIGQFGVGFYSAYLVANRVVVISMKAEEGRRGKYFKWNSTCDGTFTVEETSEKDDIEGIADGGTKIILHLKDECDGYLEDFKLKELLRKYSEFIQFPIQVWSEKVIYDRVPDVADTTAGSAAKSPVRMKTITRKKYEWQTMNIELPIWTRKKETVSSTEYVNFYKTTFKAYEEPLGYTHFEVEGQMDFKCVLFIPGTLPWELTRSMFDEHSRGIRLYVKRVFVNDKFQQALPRWLTFLRGIVDSDNLPLNVGREILQKSRLLSIINKKIAFQAIDMISRVRKSEKKEKWNKFINIFGKYIKVGVVEDAEHRQSIAPFCEYFSTNDKSSRTSLDDYILRLEANNANKNIELVSVKEDDASRETVNSKVLTHAKSDGSGGKNEESNGVNRSIYYISADSVTSALKSPALEIFLENEIEVLLATEAIDEFSLAALAMEKYKGYELVDVNKADVKLIESLRNRKKVSAESNIKESDGYTVKLSQGEIDNLCEWLLAILRDRVQKVSASQRLISSPAVLVQGEYGLSPTMQKYMKQNAAMQQSNSGSHSRDDSAVFGMNMNQTFMEVNVSHPIITQLGKIIAQDKGSQVARILATQLMDIASLQSGYGIEDPHTFAKNVTYLMSQQALNFIEQEQTPSSRDGNAITADGNVITTDGKVITADGKVDSADDKVVTAEGKVFTADDKAVSSDVKVVSSDGKVVSSEKKLSRNIATKANAPDESAPSDVDQEDIKEQKEFLEHKKEEQNENV